MGLFDSFLSSGGQAFAGPPVSVGNAGGINYGNIGNQVAANSAQGFGSYLANQGFNPQATIAQAQLKAATDQAIKNQMAMAAGARGGNAGTMQRIAMQNMAQAGQENAQQSGMLAAQQEQQNAQNALNWKTLQDHYALGMYDLANNRDMGTANVQSQNANRQMQGVKNFTDFLGNLGKGAASVIGL